MSIDSSTWDTETYIEATIFSTKPVEQKMSVDLHVYISTGVG